MKRSKRACDVSSCMMCKLCLPEWKPAIEAHKKNFVVKKGELVFKEGDPVTGIYFVFEGAIKVNKQWGADKELIIRFAKEGDIFGHRGLGKEPAFPVSAAAIENSTLCFIHLDFFEKSLKVNSSFLYELMQFFASELKDSERNMRNLAHMPVKGRVANALITLQEKFGTNEEDYINIQLSRQDIASFAGTTYETVFRILQELNEAGLVKTLGKDIGIRDLERLKTLTDHT